MDGEGEKKEKAAIIVHSGSYDRVHYTFSIALVSLALNMKGRTDIVRDETDREIRTNIEKALTKGSIQPITNLLRDAKRMGLKIYRVASYYLKEVSVDVEFG